MTFYYLLRDRIPFFLSLIYGFRNNIKNRVYLDFLGAYLFTVTSFLMVTVLGFLIRNESLTRLVGFTWSFPSPIQWGALILMGSIKLNKNRLTIFDSYYIAFIASIGGGWIYEILYGIPYWIKSGFASWNVFNLNISKVFIIDFQCLAFPIFLYIIISRYKWRLSAQMLILSLFVVCFYLFGFHIAPIFHKMGEIGGNTIYSWVYRLPVILFIYKMLSEIEGVSK